MRTGGSSAHSVVLFLWLFDRLVPPDFFLIIWFYLEDRVKEPTFCATVQSGLYPSRFRDPSVTLIYDAPNGRFIK